MQVNNAPEKIYVQLPSKNWIGRTWNGTPIKEGDNPNWKNATNIEYVRNDASIEKACEWLKANYTEYLNNTRIGIKIDEMVEDFKKDMKGE